MDNWSQGNGGGLANCSGTIRGNLICGNSAELSGAAVYNCDGTVEGNTVVDNTAADDGGGLYLCNGVIANCIIWGNAAANGSQLYGSSIPRYSCVQDWDVMGEGNINSDPLFVDPDGPDDDTGTHEDNDYRLAADSPCIDAGDSTLLTPPGLDLDGNLRIAFGKDSLTADMGAYEYDSRRLSLTTIASEPDGAVRLVWNSQPNDMYTIWRCLDLSNGEWITAKELTLPSQGAVTSWKEEPLSGSVRFYRIEMR